MSQDLADLLFPSVPRVATIRAQYPARQLAPGAAVTRFAPSPTGFVHIGSIYIALIDWLLARQSGGVFILRVEDTDQKRQIEHALEDIVEYLAAFGLNPDEGPAMTGGVLSERGSYGPYVQSERRAIYQACAKELVAAGWAYPSFQTEEELLALRRQQELANTGTGYYGPWAEDRGLTFAQIQEKLASDQPFVIRFRAPYPNLEKATIDDAIRGRIEIPGNEIDHVLLKSDGLPTYHLAVVVDDVLMGVNRAIRGEEWLGTLPLHVQLYHALGFPMPVFAHIAPIAKIEGNAKRKLSKRKDPEANVAYYFAQGYPTQAILEYLLNIADSGFGEWRSKNPESFFVEYPLSLQRMPVSMALFDLQKLNSISREVIAGYTPDALLQHALTWADHHSPDLARWLRADLDYALAALNIGRNVTPPRKDLTVWSDVEREHGYFFDEYFARSLASDGYEFPNLANTDMLLILDYCLEDLAAVEQKEKDAWLQDMKLFGEKIGFALTSREYKAHPESYKGMFGQMMEVCRIALTNKSHTPDLYTIIQIMGTQRANARLRHAEQWLQARQGT